MESALLGIVLDSSVLIAAERRKLRPDQAIESVREAVGVVSIILCSVTVAEIGHRIYRAKTFDTYNRRRAFLEELKTTVPIHAVTETTAEIIARVGGQQAAKEINLPLGDLIIGACGLELGYAVGTGNLRDFERIPELAVVRL